MFKYEVVGNNTKSNQYWLEYLGYMRNISSVSDADEMIYTRQYQNGWVYNGCPYMNIPSNYVNCLDNNKLFRAVSAIRNGSDYMQWFTDGKNFELCLIDSFELFLKDKYFPDVISINKYHKATLDELQERF